MTHVAVWQRIAELMWLRGVPLYTTEIAKHLGIASKHVKTVVNAYPQVFERLNGEGHFSGPHVGEALWSTHQLEAARLRVLYGEKPVVRGVKDVRAMVARRAG